MDKRPAGPFVSSLSSFKVIIKVLDRLAVPGRWRERPDGDPAHFGAGLPELVSEDALCKLDALAIELGDPHGQPLSRVEIIRKFVDWVRLAIWERQTSLDQLDGASECLYVFVEKGMVNPLQAFEHDVKLFNDIDWLREPL